MHIEDGACELIHAVHVGPCVGIQVLELLRFAVLMFGSAVLMFVSILMLCVYVYLQERITWCYRYVYMMGGKGGRFYVRDVLVVMLRNWLVFDVDYVCCCVGSLE